MSPLQITLIVIGIIIIIISCLLIDKSRSKSGTPVDSEVLVKTAFSEEQQKQIKNRIEQIIAETSEDTIVRTDDTLSKISNEKIIAVHEFSDQILEKINRNHEEVVFLYNMLNDKEKELKSVVKELEVLKKKTDFQTTIDSQSDTRSNTANVITQADQIEAKSAKLNQQDIANSSLDENNNDNILALYSQGKTIVEISKELNLGQGEVKLVVDLFKTKK